MLVIQYKEEYWKIESTCLAKHMMNKGQQGHTVNLPDQYNSLALSHDDS